MRITDLIVNGEKGIYEITKSSSPLWIGVKVRVSEPLTFNIEPFRTILVTEAPNGTPAKQFEKKALPLLGAVVSATFEKIS